MVKCYKPSGASGSNICCISLTVCEDEHFTLNDTVGGLVDMDGLKSEKLLELFI